MTYQRCQGLMVEERFFNHLDSSSHNNRAWRCVICGEVTDRIIVHHRAIQSRTKDQRSGLDLSRIP
ncbi:MAG: hypothetical protein AB7L09_15595 [Nitrospira sp.]